MLENRMVTEYDRMNWDYELKVGTIDVVIYFYEDCSEYYDDIEIDDVEIEYYDNPRDEFMNQSTKSKLLDCGFSMDWIDKFADDVADIEVTNA